MTHPTLRLTPQRAILSTVLLLLAVLCFAAPAAHANNHQLSVMMDDDHLLYRGEATQFKTLARMKLLGVDYVRATMLWEAVAKDAKKGKKRAKKFKADDPKTYPHANWDRYDSLVRFAKGLGIGVYFDITGPAPSFAHGRTRDKKAAHAWRPNAKAFGKFVRAVGKRYSGTYRDENQKRHVLPRVSFWSLWNEPNQGAWLTPQWSVSKKLHKKIATSPIIFRELFLRGRLALKATGHDKDVVLLGETAPLGSGSKNTRSPIRPKVFMREFFCLDGFGHPYTGKQASARDCGLVSKLGGSIRASAWAHHPYTKKLPPTKRDSSPDSISMANIGDLSTLLDQAAAARHWINPGMPVALTEFGYESNPPDPFSGVTLDQQAAYINIGDKLAFDDPRVVTTTQFLYQDNDLIKKYKKSDKRRYFNYQSGLVTAGGKHKPAYTAYVLPLVVSRTGATANVWGQLRFLANNHIDKVTLQFRPQGSTTWTTQGLPVPVTNPLGFFTATRPQTIPGSWRAVWTGNVYPGGAISRIVPVP